MGTEKNRGAVPAEVLDQLEEFILVDRIQSREWFVQNDQRRAVKDGGDELDLLLVAPGKCFELVAGPVAGVLARCAVVGRALFATVLLSPDLGVASGSDLPPIPEDPRDEGPAAFSCKACRSPCRSCRNCSTPLSCATCRRNARLERSMFRSASLMTSAEQVAACAAAGKAPLAKATKLLKEVADSKVSTVRL